MARACWLWLGSLALVLLSGCDCAGPLPFRCSSDEQCPGGRCVRGRCEPVEGEPDAALVPFDAGLCEDGRRRCADACCEERDVCGGDSLCCPREDLCGDRCCGAGQVCEGALCHVDCGARARCGDGSGAEVCCDAGEVCASGRCFMPTTTCVEFIDCAADEYCEPLTSTCMPQPGGETCAERPTGGEVRPTVVWHWPDVAAGGVREPLSNRVMMTPVVADLNGDGNPEVIFSTFRNVDYHVDGILRAVDGRTGQPVFDVLDRRVIGGAQVAVGDLDGDGRPEIVACASGDPDPMAPDYRQGPIVVFNHDGSFRWQSSDPRVRCGQSSPAIADVDADGRPEVIVRYSVLNGNDGSVRWHRECDYRGEFVRYEHLPCDYTVLADLNGDGRLELIGGNVAYDHRGEIFYDRRVCAGCWDCSDCPSCPGACTGFSDGYPAVADLDLDGTPEIVVVQAGVRGPYRVGDHFVRALRADGSDLWGPFDTNFHVPMPSQAEWPGGGPPTIANFDDDPHPEIALAGAFSYVVFEHDGRLKWARPTRDVSSARTGSSVFDFDGDGVAEAVYNDEYWLRVYDGPDGTVRYCECNTTATHWEYPVIADVTNDGHAEIVVAANDLSFIGDCRMEVATDDCTRARAAELAANPALPRRVTGVRVFASPARDWVSTRRIWNQHAYHVTNVSEAGAVPRVQRPNWRSRGLNNFRQNVQPGATNLPDLVPTDLSVELRACPRQLTLYFRVRNAGWSATAPGVAATVYVSVDGRAPRRLGRVTTTRSLLPGESELLAIDYDHSADELNVPVTFRVVIEDPSDMPSAALRECRPDNNAAMVTANCQTLF